jgi:hypothetical protein
MRHIFIALFCSILFAISCKKTNPDSLILEGTYAGTFQRLTSGGGQISNVTMTFSSNNWTGQSQYAKYPALCHGTYTINGTGKVTFENACPWTAEFDWTLILSQDYKIKVTGNNIEISRDYNGSYTDIYKLTKQ